MKAELLNNNGEKIDDIEISDYVFGIEPNLHVVTEVVCSIRDNMRQGNASTRIRSTIAGSKRKPWPQKKWGYARAGSYQSPIWRGGSVIHGPQPRSYRKKIMKKVNNLAIRSLYSDRFKEGLIKFTENLKLEEPKTKKISEHINNFTKEARNILYLTGSYKDYANIFRSGKNLSNLSIKSANYVSALDLIKADFLIITKDGLSMIHQNLSKEVKNGTI